MLLYCGDVDLGCEPYSWQLLLESITYTMTGIWPLMGVILLFGAGPAHLTPYIVESDCASVSLLQTAAIAVCKHREAAPARLSTPQHHTDENSWWECVHNTQRLLRITPSPNTLTLSPDSDWQKSFNMVSQSVQDGGRKKGNGAF